MKRSKQRILRRLAVASLAVAARRTSLLLVGLLTVLPLGLVAGCAGDSRNEAAGTVTVTVAGEVVTETVTETVTVKAEPELARPPHPHAIIAGGPGLVAVGATDAFDDKADIWTSTDGDSWKRVPREQLGFGVINDVTTFDRRAPDGPGLVAVGNGKAKGSQGAVWTSRDGLTWSRAPDDPVFKGARIEGVSWAGPGLVAVGSPSRAWFSSDGLTWELASVPPGPPDLMGDVAAAGDRLVAVGWGMMNDNSQEAVVWTSADGMTWTDVPLDPEVFPRGSSFKSVTGGQDGFIIAGDQIINEQDLGDLMWTSADGLRWRRVRG